MHVRSLFLLLLVPTGSACTWWQSQVHVLITSEPPGATIAIDGLETGYTTPIRLPLGGTFGSDHEVVLRKKGYRQARRLLVQHVQGYTSRCIDAGFEVGMPVLPPFFWTTGDFLLPFGVRGALLPAELHVQLEREDAPKLGFDLLAERASAANER